LRNFGAAGFQFDFGVRKSRGACEATYTAINASVAQGAVIAVYRLHAMVRQIRVRKSMNGVHANQGGPKRERFGSPVLVDRRTVRACNGAIMGAPKGHAKYGGGRAKGTGNRVTQEFRETIMRLLDDHRENIALWLSQVANGTLRVLDNGQVVGDPPNPGKALDLIAKLAEYGAPKLTRAEVVPPAAQSTNHIRIEFIHASPPAALRESTADVVDDPVELPTPSRRH
jgi:hypothetical protein